MKNWRRLGIAGLTGVLGAAGLWGASQTPRGEMIQLNPPPAVTATATESEVEIINIPEPTAAKVSETEVSAAADDGCILVDINTADQQELETLKGIGPVLADRIIAFREENGEFRFIEHIMDVKGIGPVTFDDIQSCITVGDSGPPDE